MAINLKDLELSPEVEAEINKRVDESEKGLKDNRDKILAQSVKFRSLLNASDDDDLAKKLSDDLQSKDDEINQLRKDVLNLKGDKEGLEKLTQSIETEEQEKQQKLKERYEARIKSSSETAVTEKVMGHMNPKRAKFAKSTLKSMLNTSIDDEGNATTVIQDGDKTYSTADDFIQAASSDESWADMMRAPDTKGINALGNQGGKAASMPNTAAEEAKKKGDKIGHLDALIAQNLKGNS